MPNAPCAAGTRCQLCQLGGFAPDTRTMRGVEAAVALGVRLTPGATATLTPAQATTTLEAP
jgi:hypothetical protein